jgi:tetratricopeptide (TPR) repeat protein
MHRGICCGYLGRHENSHRLLSEAETAAQNARLWRLIGDIRLFRAFIFYRERDYGFSSELYRSVLELQEAANDWYLRGHGLWGVGKNLMIQEQYEDAVHWLVRPLEIFENENARLAMALVWSELGVCYLGLGEDDKALGLFRKSEVVDVECGLLHGYQIDLANIGNVYLQRREYMMAISYYRKAVAVARGIKNPLSVKKWTYNINLTYARIRAQIDQQHPRPIA